MSTRAFQRSTPKRTIDTATPPWEQRSLAQVPYIDASSRCLSDAEKKALPDLWATRSDTVSKHRSTVSTERKMSSTTSHRGYDHLPSLPDDRANPWDHHATAGPWTSLPLQVAPPYETSFYVPAGPKTAPPLPPIPQATVRGPPTPPESLSKSSSFSTSASSPPSNTSPTVMALPGTMSSRKATTSKSRTSSAARSNSTTRHEKVESTGIGKRFKLAFKDIFKCNPVDESQFERLEDRHWTEED